MLTPEGELELNASMCMSDMRAYWHFHDGSNTAISVLSAVQQARSTCFSLSVAHTDSPKLVDFLLRRVDILPRVHHTARGSYRSHSLPPYDPLVLLPALTVLLRLCAQFVGACLALSPPSLLHLALSPRVLHSYSFFFSPRLQSSLNFKHPTPTATADPSPRS